jgi:hypothetical protein
MAASEAAVNAVREALKAHRYREADEGVGWECGCGEHFANYGLWQAHLAVAAADAAVDADRASIQAETREAVRVAYSRSVKRLSETQAVWNLAYLQDDLAAALGIEL